MPVDNVFGSPVLIDDILKKSDLVNPIVVSPDIGGLFVQERWQNY
ncbi:Ribose-phosphate pyrophosphokinase [Mannheimia haemolytica]|uniref:Ribose-phosphate pyrophosphokinase n=1 Tax=Mannheimia haemolytica TaxID=75985 RepID=A0A378N6R6_MANHA|nr:Ribose-phosphate pyrophosphokinase [Mannheimia haemolytica]